MAAVARRAQCGCGRREGTGARTAARGWPPPWGQEPVVDSCGGSSSESRPSQGMMRWRVCHRKPHDSGGALLARTRGEQNSRVLHLVRPLHGFIRTQTGRVLPAVGPWRPLPAEEHRSRSGLVCACPLLAGAPCQSWPLWNRRRHPHRRCRRGGGPPLRLPAVGGVPRRGTSHHDGVAALNNFI